MVELKKKDVIHFALYHAEDLVYEARDIYVDEMNHANQADCDPDILEKFYNIIDAICDVRIRITCLKKAEESEDEPYEKSEKDCMWE